MVQRWNSQGTVMEQPGNNKKYVKNVKNVKNDKNKDNTSNQDSITS